VDCAFCGAALTPLSNPHFALCKKDKIIFNLAHETTAYEQDYFDKEYSAQYGKSYTADREAILLRNAARQRLTSDFFTATTHPRVLEVGSAAGYFLETMHSKGFTVCGWEISRTMADYAKQRGFQTQPQDFMSGAKRHAKSKAAPYDVLALFYVLEHLPDQPQVWRCMAHLVRPGGFLLLALPSAAGPMFRFHRQRWFQTHPKDHALDYTPQGVARVGARFGFRLVKAMSEGIHPNRFPFGKIWGIDKLYKILIERRPVADTFFAILEKTT